MLILYHRDVPTDGLQAESVHILLCDIYDFKGWAVIVC